MQQRIIYDLDDISIMCCNKFPLSRSAPCYNLQSYFICDAVLPQTEFHRVWSLISSWPYVDRRFSATAQYVDRSRSDWCDPTYRKQVRAGLVRAGHHLTDIRSRVELDTVAERRRPARQKVLEKSHAYSYWLPKTGSLWDQENLLLILILQLSSSSSSSWQCSKCDQQPMWSRISQHPEENLLKPRKSSLVYRKSALSLILRLSSSASRFCQ